MKFISSATALLICLSLPSIIKSTCIVIYIDSRGIYAVAVTRRTNTINGRDGRSYQEFTTTQKIHSIGKYYVAIAGIDSDELLKTALKTDTSRSLLQNAETFAERTKSSYKALMLKTKKLLPEKYKIALETNLGEIAFFTKNKSSLELIHVWFGLKEKNGMPEVYYRIQKDLDHAFLGRKENLLKLTAQQFFEYISTDIIEGLIKLVKLEMRYDPKGIACPYDVLYWTTTPILTRRGCN